MLFALDSWASAVAIVLGIACLVGGALSRSWPAIAAGAALLLFARHRPHALLRVAVDGAAMQSLERAGSLLSLAVHGGRAGSRPEEPS